MIIDGHAHVLPRIQRSVGYASLEEHMRAVQVHLVAPSQPVIETATGRRVTEDTLSDGRGLARSNLLDVNFRFGDGGRCEWTKDGVAYHLQMFAPDFTGEVTPEALIALMDEAGVAKALLHNAHMYGMLNDYLGEIVRQYPARFAATAQIHEARGHTAEQIAELTRAVEELGLVALHFQVEGFFENDFRDRYCDDKYTAFWEEVRRLGIPVLWNIRPVRLPRRSSYIEEIARLGRWARKWPGIPSVFTHGVNVGLLTGESGTVTIPDELWHTLEADNMFLELLLPIMQGGRWSYPFPEGQELVAQFHRRLGADKMLWGSDYPTVARSVTYRESLDYIRAHCAFLPESDLDRILGGTAAELYRFN